MLMMDDNDDDDDDDDDNDNDDDDDNCLHYNALRIIASLEVPSYPDRLAHCIFARSEHVGFWFFSTQQRSIARLFSTD